MIVLAGADVVLADRVMKGGCLLVDGGRIVALEPRVIDGPAGALRLDLPGHLVLPGFIDVHVHGVGGVDVLDGAGAVGAVAAMLPRYGVTAFCPTSVACDPVALSALLTETGRLARATTPSNAARVLPAHLESNFIDPAYRGAQPGHCLRHPPRAGEKPQSDVGAGGPFTGANVLAVIEEHRAAVAVVTLAPELEGGLDLVRRLTAAGVQVSIGHTGATFEQAVEAISVGVRRATHLFNCMPPLSHRNPGAAGAVLASDDVVAEIICDGVHVHPVMIRLALAAKSAARVMAITDGTAGAGLTAGSRARLGTQAIIVTPRGAQLDDGTLAGSVATMDAVFRMLVRDVGVSPVEAARLCATTPAEQLGLSGTGVIARGAAADLTVLGPALDVRQTLVAGHPLL